MLEEIFVDLATCKRLRSGPIGHYVDGFVTVSRQQGFAVLTVQEHLRVVGAFNQWLTWRGLEPKELHEARLEEFMRYRRRHHRQRLEGRKPLARLLAYLRELGVTPPPEPGSPSNALERLLQEFKEHLVRDRELAHHTVARYGPFVRQFLQARFHRKPIRFKALRSSDVQSFIVDFGSQHSRAQTKDLVSALRAFLRWLQFRGLIETDLAAVVPSVADWRLRSVPTTLKQGEVRKVLRACDRRTATGRRDYAVILLLARLGLRAGEIVRMRLEDVNWRDGEILIRRKAGREDRLPLPHDVGEALVAYLQHARPTCKEPRVFLCMHAPYRGFSNSVVVSCIVAAALRRAGLTRRGAHVLRHTLATTLLQQGATLTEIGALLGHGDFGATEIYAKVDLKALRPLAQPWPGGY